MTKDEFIAAYQEDAGPLELAYMEGAVALPCACGDEDCQGWAMVPNESDFIAEFLRVQPSGPGFVVGAGTRWIFCNECKRTSYSAGDVRERYCANCKKFHDDEQAGPVNG